MRVDVDGDRCQGHTNCNRIAPEVFGLGDEDGHAVVLVAEVPQGLEKAVRRAAANCPEEAIVVDETVKEI
jgi:ferredoxin